MPSEQMPQPLPWVDTLNQSHKKIIMDNKELCSDIICFAQSILKKQFPDSNGFHDTTLAPIKLNDKWISNNSFQTQSHPSVQIHHTGLSQHWVTSIQLDKTNIYLLDSLSLKLSTSLEMQLAQIYGKKRKNISINDIQRQDNSINCGLFAIANMIEFCANEYTGNLNLQFNTKYLREHLIFCLEQGHFRPFPKLESSSKFVHNKPEIHSIVLSCECGNPDTIANLDVGDLYWYCNKLIINNNRKLVIKYYPLVILT